VLSFFTEDVLNNPGSGEYQRAYKSYIKSIQEDRELLPDKVYELATASWYFNARDKKCLKDGWVIGIELTNEFDFEIKRKKKTIFTLKLLGAYHDRVITLSYMGVTALNVQDLEETYVLKDGYDSWRIDEFSVVEEGFCKHLIYFISGKVWEITFEDLKVQTTEI
jgi:hypothetical protein